MNNIDKSSGGDFDKEDLMVLELPSHYVSLHGKGQGDTQEGCNTDDTKVQKIAFKCSIIFRVQREFGLDLTRIRVS